MKALIIPKKYLTAEKQVKTDVGLETVKTGLQTLDSIEILSGINAETAIYTLP
jgi:HlyD family secretion protein